MKHTSLLLLSIALLLSCSAQEDSLVVSKAKWKKKKIASGVYLKHLWFDHSLFASNQNISILEVKLNRRNRVDVGADPKVLKPTSSFGEEYKALAALNGTFFDMKNGGSVDYIRVDGKVVNNTRIGKNKQRALHQKAALVLQGNEAKIVAWDGTAHWEDQLVGEDVMVTGPLLIDDQVRTTLDTTSMYTARHPRTAVALKGNKLLLITVDGRNQRAAGMTLFELASLLKWLGAEDGINLDGGGSTTLWIQNFPDGGVINYPSDNKKMLKSTQYKPGMDLDNLAADEYKWDHSGERPVANVLFISKKK